MTVPQQNPIASYTANGLTAGPFTFPFRILDSEDLKVSLGGVVVSDSTYTITGIGEDEGSITFASIPNAGVSIVLYRQVALERLTDYQFNGDFRAVTVNADFDRIWMALQDTADTADRAVRYPVTEFGTDGELPVSTVRAGTVLGWDPNGAQTLYPLPSSLGAGDLRFDTFSSGSGFTPDVTTQLVLSRSPINKANCWVYWDGVPQLDFSVAANILTFPTPIPTGVSNVYVRTGTTLSLGLPAQGSVTDDSIAAGTKLFVRINNEVSLTDPAFGARMDGTTDDSVAFNAAVAYCTAHNVSLWVPDGHCMLPNVVPITTGRLTLRGNGHGVLVGNIVYSNPSFPACADITTPLDETAPFFSSHNICFKSPNSNFALTVGAQVQPKFIDTCEIIGAKFYGKNGFRGQNLIGVNVSNCRFFNSLIGAQAEGCTNWTVDSCRFYNQAQYGFKAIPYAANPARTGGENLRFTQCEFDCASIGVLLQQTLWSTFDTCLFDYCGLPLFMQGANFVKLSQCYLGSILLGSLSSISGYAAPPTNGIALYARPFVDGLGNVSPSGFSATNCEFVTYLTGSTLPVVLADGDVVGQPGARAIDRASLSQCKVLSSVTHSMSYMAQLSKCQVADISDSEFISYNLSSSMVAPYTMVNCTTYRAEGNDSSHCTQSNVQVQLTQEKTIANVLQMLTDSNGVAIQNSASVSSALFLGTGNDRVQIYTGSQLRSVGVGSADSGGAGYRQLIVPN